MRNMHVIPEVKLIMSALKLVALVRLLMVVVILSLGYCSLAKADDGQSLDRGFGNCAQTYLSVIGVTRQHSAGLKEGFCSS
jgi:hypothetical protein